MLKQIYIENFQSHKNTVVDLHPGLNMITGTTDSGKSAILRSLRWLVLNRPSGDSVVSNFIKDKKGKATKDTKVTLTFDDTVLERVKSPQEGNRYTKDEQVFEAVGMDVPEQIQKACNFTDSNLQAQMDAPFLLSSTAGEVARFFNKIIGLDKIDAYLSAVESKKRKTKSDLDLAKGNLDRVSRELDTYRWIDKAEKLIDKTEKLEKKRDALFVAKERLNKDIHTYTDAYLYLKGIADFEDAETLVESITEQEKDKNQIQQEHSSLVKLCETYRQAEKMVSLGAISDKAEKLMDKIAKIKAKKEEVQEKQDQIQQVIAEYYPQKAFLDGFNSTLSALVESLPKTCPTCGQEIK